MGWFRWRKRDDAVDGKPQVSVYRVSLQGFAALSRFSV
jgi:hypothetical protein